MSGEGTFSAVIIGDSAAAAEAKAAPPSAPPPPAAATRAAPFSVFLSKSRARGEWKRGVSCFDFLVRVFAVGACMAAAIIMGTTEETLPFFTQLFQFHAKYDDLPAFTFFVIGNAIAGGYLLLSIPFSLIGVVRPRAVGVRLLLLIFDTVMVSLTAASAASAAAIVYLAHTGNAKANWVEICRQFNNFCQQTSGAVVASFVATVLLMVLVVISALALRKH